METLEGNYGKAIIADNLPLPSKRKIKEILDSKISKGEYCCALENCGFYGKRTIFRGLSLTYTPGNPINPSLLGPELGFGFGVIFASQYLPEEKRDPFPYKELKLLERGLEGLGTTKKRLPAEDEKSFKKFLKKKLEGLRGKVGGLVKFSEGLGNIDRFISSFCHRLGVEEEKFWFRLGRGREELPVDRHQISIFKILDHSSSDFAIVVELGPPVFLIEAVEKYWTERAKKGRILKKEMKEAEKEIKKKYRGEEGVIKEKIQALHKSKKFTIPPSDLLVYPSDLTSYLEDIFTLQVIAEWTNFYVISRILEITKGYYTNFSRYRFFPYNYLDPLDNIFRVGCSRCIKDKTIVHFSFQQRNNILIKGISKDNSEWNDSYPIILPSGKDSETYITSSLRYLSH